MPNLDSVAMIGTLNGKEFHSTAIIHVQYRASNRENQASLHVERNSIFVGHLPKEIDESQLFEKFSPFGEISSMALVRRGKFLKVSL